MKLKLNKIKISKVQLLELLPKEIDITLMDKEIEATFNGSELKVLDDCCWCCGKSVQQINQEKNNNMTEHHSIPQRYKPKFNVLIPVCRRCHNDKINKVDFGAIVSMGYKAKHLLNTMMNLVKSCVRDKENKNRKNGYKEPKC